MAIRVMLLDILQKNFVIVPCAKESKLSVVVFVLHNCVPEIQ